MTDAFAYLMDIADRIDPKYRGDETTEMLNEIWKALQCGEQAQNRCKLIQSEASRMYSVTHHKFS